MFEEGQPQLENEEQKKYTRREILRKGAAFGAAALLGSFGLSALGKEGHKPQTEVAAREKSGQHKTVTPEKKKLKPFEIAKEKLEKYRLKHPEEKFSPYYVVVDAGKHG